MRKNGRRANSGPQSAKSKPADRPRLRASKHVDSAHGGTVASDPVRGEQLGLRLRRLRRERGWTLAELSKSTGLSISTLSKVENNQLSLTYHNLSKLALGLDIDIAELFTAHVVEGSAGLKAYCPLGQGRLHESANYAHRYLFAELANRRMVPIFTRVKARSIEQFGAMIQHPGQEFLFVLEGAIDLYIEPDGPVRMHAGDSYYFDARSAHAAVSVGVGDAIIVSVISQIPQRQ